MPPTKVELFYSARKYLKALGFYAPSEPNQKCALNRKNVFYMFALAGMIIPVMAFLIFEAETAFEYSDPVFQVNTFTTVFIYFVFLIFRLGKILSFIQSNEEFITKRKQFQLFFSVSKLCGQFQLKFTNYSEIGIEHNPASKALYEELSAKIERSSQRCYFFLVKVILTGAFVPPLILSFVNYFLLHLGEQSFLLAFPIL